MSFLFYFLGALALALGVVLIYVNNRLHKVQKQLEGAFKMQNDLYQRYKGIIDIEKARSKLVDLFKIERAKVHETMQQLKQEYDRAVAARDKKRNELDVETARSLKAIDVLKAQLNGLEEEAHMQEFGSYSRRYAFDPSERFGRELEELKQKQRELIKEEKAAVFVAKGPSSNGSIETKPNRNDYVKLVLRAFNGASDTAIARVHSDNMLVMEKRIKEDWESVNRLSRSLGIGLTREYRDLKLNELHLAYESREQEAFAQRRMGQQPTEERTQTELETTRFEAVSEGSPDERALVRV
jgi:hypothetical protein